MNSETNCIGECEDNKYENVQVSVPWGHISGKWWGDRNMQPILAIHGWQDNSCSFDGIAPALVEQGHSVFCIDLPGHGLSSHLPDGVMYYIFWDGLFVVRRLVKHFDWKKITIIGHSLGGAVAFLYAASFPDDVERYISLDMASASVRLTSEMPKIVEGSIDRFLKYETLPSALHPCYTYEEMLEMILDGYKGSVTRDGIKVLMKRSIKPAEGKEGQYVLTRDPRLKVAGMGLLSIDQSMEFASRITCEVLNIKATPGFEWPDPNYYDQILNQIEKNCKRLVRVSVEGAHHVHLNEPEKVISHIVEFLKN